MQLRSAKKLFGRARELKHFSSLILGRNIGCAHYLNGKLYRGYNGGASEVGHITLDPAGPHCRCGKNGCLDMFAGGTAIQTIAEQAGIAIQSMRDLEALAADGNVTAIALLRSGGQALGMAVASLIQINNPECVLFADVEGFGKGLFQTMARQTIENNILPRFLASTQIVFHHVERSFLARAAASIATQEYLRTGLNFFNLAASSRTNSSGTPTTEAVPKSYKGAQERHSFLCGTGCGMEHELGLHWLGCRDRKKLLDNESSIPVFLHSVVTKSFYHFT